MNRDFWEVLQPGVNLADVTEKRGHERLAVTICAYFRHATCYPANSSIRSSRPFCKTYLIFNTIKFQFPYAHTMKFLTGPAIRDTIHELMAKPGERVIAVAFIGANPLAWIPDPSEIEIYCWPKVGATVPDGIDALDKQGARVHFVDKLHTKIYWHRDHGAVVGSANLSHNALSDGGLTEAGVLVPPGDSALAGLLNSLFKRAVQHRSDAYFDALALLRREHNKYLTHNPAVAQELAGPASRLTFGDWLALDPRSRRVWQLGWYQDTPQPPADTAIAQAESYGGATFANYRATPTREGMLANVATLDCRLTKDFTLYRSGKGSFWWYPQDVRESGDPDWLELPFQWYAQQLKPEGEIVPFDEKEPRFLLALRRALEEYEGDLTAVCGVVPEDLVTLLEHHYNG